MAIAKKIAKLLDEHKVRYDVVQHKKVFTVYDLGQTLREEWDGIAKTVLAKVDAQYILIVVPAHYRVDFKKVKKLFKAKKVDIAKEKDMQAKFHVKAGAMTPFGTIHHLQVVADTGILRVKKMLFGSGSFTESIRMNVKDFVNVVNPQIAKIGEKFALKMQPKPKPKKKHRRPKKRPKNLQRKKKK